MIDVLLASAALCSAALSGVFGMAGGMLLMGVYVSTLSVPTAMVMHGATQLLANAARAWLLRRHVHWRGFQWYAVGALLAFGCLSRLDYTPGRTMVLLGLGSTPFVAAAVPRRWLDFQQPRAACITGSLVASVQLLAGAAGPLLDSAFVDTPLDRNQVVATKAVTQVFSHALKLWFFIPALHASHLTVQLVAAVSVATLAGTQIGTLILSRISDTTFRRYTRILLYAIGCVYLAQAGILCAG